MTDDLVKRARDAHQDSSERTYKIPLITEMADRIEALTAERDDWKKRHFKMRDERDKKAIAAKNYADFNHEWRKRAERAEADNARLRGRPATSVPDYCYDDEWESTMPWDLRNELVEFADLTTPVPVYTLFKGPTQWAVNIPIDTDGDGEADDFELAWFDSEAEALAALNTGKEVMPFVPVNPANQPDIGPGDQGAAAGAALDPDIMREDRDARSELGREYGE
jgi:hypothetical protein